MGLPVTAVAGGGISQTVTISPSETVLAGATGVIKTLTPVESDGRIKLEVLSTLAGDETGFSIKRDGVTVISSTLLDPGTIPNIQAGYTIGSGSNTTHSPMTFGVGEVITLEKDTGSTARDIFISYSEVKAG